MPERRRIRDGEEYEFGEDVDLETPDPDPNPPPEDVRGEPWGWTKPGDRPRGWPGPDHRREDPGPYDGEWEPRR